MEIYFSVEELKVADKEYVKSLRKLMKFLQDSGNVVSRAPFAFSNEPDVFLQKELGLNRKPTLTEQGAAHMKWVDNADLMLADVSIPSEGRSMAIQRALDKPEMGMHYTPIIFIKAKKLERNFGRLIKGLIESGKVTYYEYANIDEVIKNWPKLVKKALSK